MMKQALLTAALLAVLAAPAGAQTLAATSSTTASSALLTSPEQVLPQPTLHERRTLASAAFEKPIDARPAPAFRNERPIRDEAPFQTRVLVKDEWTSDDGFRLDWATLEYKRRF